MRLSLTMLPRLIAKIVGQRRISMPALTACALATLWATTANAQLVDGLVYPSEAPVGSSALTQNMSLSDMPQSSPQGGLFVGPGGETSSLNVPSAMDPTAGKPTKYVNQAWAQGPFMQAQPTMQDAGIPCPCDPGCDFAYYGSAEALYFRRDNDERFTLSQFRMQQFDYEWAGRVTVGHIWDCVNGYEFVYAGPFDWNRSMGAFSPGGNLLSRMTATGLPIGAISTFNNANFHNQTYRARFNTFELNRRWWAWDVFSVLIGMRAVDYREDYAFISQNAFGTGIYTDSTRNRMFGPQIGGEYNQAFGLKALLGFKVKAAALANFDRNEVALTNANFQFIDSVNSDLDLAGLFEFGANLKYSLTPSIRLTAGYEVWYLPGVVTVPGQGINNVSPSIGDSISNDSSLVLHGAAFGAQILY